MSFSNLWFCGYLASKPKDHYSHYSYTFGVSTSQVCLHSHTLQYASPVFSLSFDVSNGADHLFSSSLLTRVLMVVDFENKDFFIF